MPSDSALNMAHKEPSQTDYWWKAEIPSVLCCFPSGFATHYGRNVDTDAKTSMKPRGSGELSLSVTLPCKSACPPPACCKGFVHPAEQSDIAGDLSREEISEVSPRAQRKCHPLTRVQIFCLCGGSRAQSRQNPKETRAMALLDKWEKMGNRVRIIASKCL